MAMTKKEEQAMRDMARRLRVAGALRFTTAVQPDRLPPKNSGEYVVGWRPHAYFGSGSTPGAEQGWTATVSHGSGPVPTKKDGSRDWNRSGTQGGRPLYSSRLLALRAARNIIEQEAAERLAKLDEMIDAEEQAPTPLETQ